MQQHTPREIEVLAQNVFSGIFRWKNLENRFTFAEVIMKQQVSCIFWLTIYICLLRVAPVEFRRDLLWEK